MDFAAEQHRPAAPRDHRRADRRAHHRPGPGPSAQQPPRSPRARGSRTWASRGSHARRSPTASLADVHGALYDGIIIHDALSVYFTFLFLGIGAVTLLLSVDSVPRFSRWNAEFYALVVWCTLGHMILTSAGELFTIFITMQLTSLPLIVLIGYAKRDPKSNEAALKYLLLVLVSTAVLVYGMSLIYGSLGTSTISEIGVRLSEIEVIPPAVVVGLVLLLTGFAFKITAAPFHYWVPDTYEGAPTPTTAFMSVGSKFAGFALALRIIVTGLKVPMEWALIFGVMAALSMTLGQPRRDPPDQHQAHARLLRHRAGGLPAHRPRVAHQGGRRGRALLRGRVLAREPRGVRGGHRGRARPPAATRSRASRDSSKRAPLVALAGAIALLSLGGLPLMAGFMAKFYVFLSAAQAGLIWLVVIGVINSVIALYYYLRVVFVMYVREGDTEPLAVDRPVAVAMSLCVAGVLAVRAVPRAGAAGGHARGLGALRRIAEGERMTTNQILLAATILVPLFCGIAISLIPESLSRLARPAALVVSGIVLAVRDRPLDAVRRIAEAACSSSSCGRGSRGWAPRFTSASTAFRCRCCGSPAC